MTYTNLCQQHDQLCCPACISGAGSHSKCTTLLLKEVIKTAKISTLLQSVEESLKHLKINLNKIINDYKINLQELDDLWKRIEKEVRQLKEKIVKHLNDIEKIIAEELNTKVNQNTTKLKSEMAGLEQRLMKTEKFINETNVVAKETDSLQKSVSKGSFRRRTVTFEQKKKITEIIEYVFNLVNFRKFHTNVLRPNV